MSQDHIETFVRESEENIVDLNNSLLSLEDDPTNDEAIDLIFRTAHTLKGNFSAMGFQQTGDLAHAMEDLLDEIRHDQVDVSAEVMDLLFEAVDGIEQSLRQIEEDGSTDGDFQEIIDAIRARISAGDSPRDSGELPLPEERSSAGDLPAEKSIPGDIEPQELSSIESTLLLAEVTLGESEMSSVDGMLVLESVEENFELLGTEPAIEAINEGEFTDSIDLLLAADSTEVVRSELAGLGNVADVVVWPVPELSSPVEDGDEGSSDARATVGESDAEGGNEKPEGEAIDSSDEGDGSDGATNQGEVSSDEIKSIRVDVDQLDNLYGLVEQLVTSRIKMRRATDDRNLDAVDETLDDLDKISTSLQGTVMDMRLVPLKQIVNKFPRMVRDLARDQGKEISFGMEGTDIELDRTILDEISDPLMHILRNAVDHGIEPPEEREEKDKPREGNIQLRAVRERDHVEITIEDDGGGLDIGNIREKALEKEIRTETELEEMEESELYDLIFHPGFSTSQEITDVSGRGVGMDVVANTVNRLDGTVSVDSALNEGTAVTLRLPVSVAIVKVLLIDVAGNEFGIPIKAIDEISRNERIDSIDGKEAIDHQGSIYSIIDLRTVLAEKKSGAGNHNMVLHIREEVRKVALKCDSVSTLEEVVIKPLDGEIRNVPGLGGTAVIGDGNVVPIIDVSTL